jgi:tRNA pseudouridine32 synthase/23S rRNA pseudouridine746 synthase
MRHGLAPSVLHLRAGPWPSLLAFLLDHFPHVGEDAWRTRLIDGQVFDDAGQPYLLDSAYPANRRIWYFREVASEAEIPFDAPILFRDERLLVADKPHFLACMPSGQHVYQTLLTRLRDTLSLPDLTPIHRLDRETAGVMLFCTSVKYRAAYQTLFQQRAVHKEYEAIGGFRPDLALPTVHKSRLCERQENFQMIEVDGEPNSETRIELIERHGALARYRLTPLTGKKHQLRAHLAALGIGILHDPWYPTLLATKDISDFSAPLCLVARSIEFVDPIDGGHRCFRSTRTLAWPAT